MRLLRFVKFIMDEIFPGGQLPYVAQVEEHATKAGFEISRIQPLRLHYARTLEIWGAALEARKDEAIAIQSEEVYERYMKYLTGCADLFRQGYTDVCQFTLERSSQARSLRTERCDRVDDGSRIVQRYKCPRTGHLDHCRVREQRGQPPAERGREGAVADPRPR